jgi:hypothetical protein
MKNKMITLIQIDKSGRDIFEKDYSVVVVVDKKYVYGANISQKVKDKLISSFKQGHLKILKGSDKSKRNRFRIRFHTAAIIRILDKILKDLGFIDSINIELCNDMDGHFHEIKDMIFKNLSKKIPTIKPEDIVLAKFQKPSLIDEAGKAFRSGNKNSISEYINIDLEAEELQEIIKK